MPLPTRRSTAARQGSLQDSNHCRLVAPLLHHDFQDGRSHLNVIAPDQVLTELRSRCNATFDPTSADTKRALIDIWNTAFPSDPISEVEVGSHWQRLGFQSSRPCSDIRAGRFALDQLEYMACRYPERLRQLAQEAEMFGYPFACSCFNVSQVIVVFFDLSDRPCMGPVSGTQQAKPRQLSNFLDLCGSSLVGPCVVMDELFCILVQHLHDAWKIMKKDGNVNLMDFSNALRRIHDANAFFWSQGCTDIMHLRQLRMDRQYSPAPEFVWTGLVDAFGTMVSDVVAHVLGTLPAQDWFLKLTTVLAALLTSSTRQTLPSDGCTEANYSCGSYVPPKVPVADTDDTVQVHVPIVVRGPIGKSADALDFDAIFDNLGIRDE